MNFMKIWFENIWIPGLVLLPNFMLLIKIPKYIPNVTEKEPIIFVLLEKTGQIGFFILPLFYQWKIDKRLNVVLLILMFGCLLVYYFCWIRFLIRDYDYKYLFIPLTKIPIPMAIFPVLYLFFASCILYSDLLIATMIVFAIGHFRISWLKYRQLSKI
jgi:hypothetical protein